MSVNQTINGNLTTKTLSTITFTGSNIYSENATIPNLYVTNLNASGPSGLLNIENLYFVTSTGTNLFIDSIESSSSTLNIGTSSNKTSALNIGTSNSVQTINLGTVGSNNTTIKPN